MRGEQVAQLLGGGVEAVERKRVPALRTRCHHEGAIAVESHRRVALVVNHELLDELPRFILRRAPIRSPFAAGLFRDGDTDAALAIGEPLHDVTRLAEREERLLAGGRVKAVDVGVAVVRVVGDDDHDVRAVAQRRQHLRVTVDELSRDGRRTGEHAKLAAVALYRVKTASALRTCAYLPVDDGEHQAIVVHPLEPCDVAHAHGGHVAGLARRHVDRHETRASVHRHDACHVLTGRRKLELAVVGMLEERLDIDARAHRGGRGGKQESADEDAHHVLLSTSFATRTTLSGSKPNFFMSSLSGAEAPNVSMPITLPRSPT